MEDIKLLSICIPTFNRPALLKRCILSVINQNFGRFFDLEIIISDDSINDSSQKEIKDLLDTHSYISYRRNENDPSIHKESKQAANFNRLISMAKGKYIYILHDDDYMVEGGLNIVFSEIDSMPDNNNNLIVFSVNIVNSLGKILRKHQLQSRVFEKNEGFRQIINNSSLVRTPGVIINSQVYKKIGNYNLERRIPLDYDMWIRASANYKLRTSSKIIANYTIHNQTQTMQMFTKETLDILKDIFSEAKKYEILKEPEFAKCQSNFFYKWILAGTYRQLKNFRFFEGLKIFVLFKDKDLGFLKPDLKWSFLKAFFSFILIPLSFFNRNV